jgi:hypothetical protein
MLWPSLDGKWHKLCPKCHQVQTYSRLRFARLQNKKEQVCRSCKWDDRYSDLNAEGVPLPWFKKYYRGAKERKISFDLTVEDVAKVLSKQNYKCALSGQDISFKAQRGKIHLASIDRVDSSKGYFKNNIQIVHKDINMMKLDHSQEYFIEMCKKIAEHNK